MATTALQTWIDLFCLDVRENPAAYKQHVRDNPESAARETIGAGDDDHILFMISDLLAERLEIAKHLTPKRPA